MGLPMLEKERLYSFFKSYENSVKQGHERPLSFKEHDEPPMISKVSALWSPAEESVGEAPPVGREITDNEILRHITSCFTDGVLSRDHLARLKSPKITSDLPYMQEDAHAYDFFIFWLELPPNEWLDAFLFEAAASWQLIAAAKNNNEALLAASFDLSLLDRPASLDRLQNTLERQLLDEDESKEFSEKIAAYKETAENLNKLSTDMRSIIENKKMPELFHTEEVKMTKGFFENKFMMKRVKENRKNIGAVRHALKDLELGEEE